MNREFEKPFLTFTVEMEDAGMFLTGVLRNRYGLSRGMIRRLKHDGCVLADGAPIPMRRRLNGGERIELYLPPSAESAVDPEELPLAILFEDDHLLVADKPAGMLVHPAGGTLRGTLANAVAHHLIERGERNAAGPVTRLDRDTSGLVLFAKHPHAHHRLEQALATRDVKRVYLGFVEGRMPAESGVIEAPIRRAPGSVVKREVGLDGRPAVTNYRVVETFPKPDGPIPEASLVEFSLETGRTHQIRVHAAHVGRPLLGDTLYGRPLTGVIERQALHARSLRLVHPIDGRPLTFHSPLPPDMLRLKAHLGKALPGPGQAHTSP